MADLKLLRASKEKSGYIINNTISSAYRAILKSILNTLIPFICSHGHIIVISMLLLCYLITMLSNKSDTPSLLSFGEGDRGHPYTFWYR